MPNPDNRRYKVTNKDGSRTYGLDLDKTSARKLADDLRRKAHVGGRDGDRGAKAVPDDPGTAGASVTDVRSQFHALHADRAAGRAATVPQAADSLLASLLIALAAVDYELGKPETAYNDLRAIWADQVSPILGMAKDYLGHGTAILNPIEQVAIPGSTLDGGIAHGEVERIAQELDAGVVAARAGHLPLIPKRPPSAGEMVGVVGFSDEELAEEFFQSQDAAIDKAPPSEPVPTVEDVLDDDDAGDDAAL